MRHTLIYPRRMWLDRWSDRAALVACLSLPLALLHARAAAEMLIAGIDAAFLLHVWVTRDLAWLRRAFTWAALAWWAWLVICSALGTGGLLLALVAIRLPLLSVAAGEWVLARIDAARRRHWLWMVLAAGLVWIGVACWQQYLTGYNLFGQPRWGDGALTGPFNKPRAGPAFILLFFPVLVPAASLLAAGARWRRMIGLVLAVLAVATLVLIGQRMPFVLMLLGLAITALLVRRLRVPVLAACVLGGALLAALPWVSPAANGKLVLRFGDQLRHFADSDYGIIFVRALTVWQAHPWLGLGFDGFRRGCADFWTMHGIDWLGVATYQLNGGMRACNLHPHNYYLEAADDAGMPGLVLFGAMVLAATARLGRRLGRDGGGPGPEPALRTGLFVGWIIALWPLASTSAFTSMPNGGWVFLLAGLGFAAGGPRAERGVRRAVY